MCLPIGLVALCFACLFAAESRAGGHLQASFVPRSFAPVMSCADQTFAPSFGVQAAYAPAFAPSFAVQAAYAPAFGVQASFLPRAFSPAFFPRIGFGVHRGVGVGVHRGVGHQALAGQALRRR